MGRGSTSKVRAKNDRIRKKKLRQKRATTATSRSAKQSA